MTDTASIAVQRPAPTLDNRRTSAMKSYCLRVALSAYLLFACSPLYAESRVVSGPLVVSENWPECTNLQTWMHDIMRLENVENASETTQAKVFFRWLRLFSKMATGGMLQAHEGFYGKERYVLDAHKNLFVYGWGYCDTHSRIAEAAWSEFKKDRSAAERVITQHHGGGYHTMYRLKLDGHYGAFDARYGYYLIDRDSPDARILDWAEVGVDENILKNKGYKNRSQPFFEYFGKEWDRALAVEPNYFQTEDDWVKAGSPKGKRVRQRTIRDGNAASRHEFPVAEGDYYRALLEERPWKVLRACRIRVERRGAVSLVWTLLPRN